MKFLRIVTSSGLAAVAFAATGLAPAAAADRSEPFVKLAQQGPPPVDPNAKKDDKDPRKGKDGGERRGGGEGGERRGGGEGRGDRGGDNRGDRGGDQRRGGPQPTQQPNNPPVAPQQRQVTPPQAPPTQRQVITPPQGPPTVPQQRQVSPPPNVPQPSRRDAPVVPQQQQQQRQVTPQQTPPPRAERPNKLQELRDRMRERVQVPNRGDDRRDFDRRDDRDNRFGRDRDDRRPNVQDNQRPSVQIEERRGPPPPPRLESFKDRFRSRIGEDKAIQDLRRGRDERVRERRDRVEKFTPFRGFEDLKARRQERREGNRIVIEEPDKRSIIRDGNRTIIRTDERERWNRNFRDVRRERRNGRDVSIAIGFGGVKIYEDFDDDGRTRRRWRVGPDGREITLFDNSRSDRWRSRRGRPDGGLFDAIIDLPPPRLRIPRDEYIVDYERASDDDIYDALSAPPVEEIDDRYSLDEIRSSYSVRDRMRRVDLDTINFEFGSWDVNEADYDRLERLARAMRRVLRNNPDEMFLVEGHTDAVGSDEDNLTLSDRRAESVARILSEEFQVPQENMTTQGYGEQFLKIDTSEPEVENRRVAVRRITPLLAR